MSNDLFDRYFEGLEKMQRWMIDDLTRSTIKAQANFLVAMGALNYIEILGHFFYFQERKYASEAFEYSLSELFPQDYGNLVDQLSALVQKGGAYDVLRCGMSHQYLMKTYRLKDTTKKMKFTIVGVDSLQGFQQCVSSLKVGIQVLEISETTIRIVVYNPVLISHLDSAFETYKRKLLQSKVGEDFRDRFLKRAKLIQLDEFD